MVSDKLLAQYGFLNAEGKKLMGHLSVKERIKILNQLGDVSKYVSKEIRKLNEGAKDASTGYPKSLSSYRFIYEANDFSMEESYFWTINELTIGSGNFRKDEIEKITDVFSASSMSTVFGTSSQRLSIQQDKVAQYLKLISDMVKSMFQIIGDINKIDEKLGYYKSSFNKDSKLASDGEYILKGQFIDLVEGGAKSPTSVFGMAREVGFATLPDLFFKVNVSDKKLEDVLKKLPSLIDNLQFGNEQVKRVLKMKLSQYYRFKFKSYEQLLVYRKLYIGYLRQHYNNVKLYMNWVKPYLRNIRRLSINQKMSDSIGIVSAFEGSLIEIEIMAKTKVGSHYAVVIVNFDYTASPKTTWDPRYQQNKVGFVGRLEMNIKSYAWTKKEIENYKAMKDAENLELIKEIDAGIKEGMEAVEEKVLEYLNEKTDDVEDNSSLDQKYEIKNGKIVKITSKKKQKNDLTAGSILEPFVELAKGFQIFTEPFKINFASSYSSKSSSNPSGAKGAAKVKSWLLYKIYKKSHRVLAW